MPVGHAYLCAVMDWRSHKVLCCMEAALCLNALHKALSLTGTKPGNFNCLRSAALGSLTPCAY